MRDFIKAVRVLGFWRCVWATFFYRHVMRLMHSFNLHYAPPVGPKDYVKTPMGWLETRQHWCQWCGLRDSLIVRRQK